MKLIAIALAIFLSALLLAATIVLVVDDFADVASKDRYEFSNVTSAHGIWRLDKHTGAVALCSGPYLDKGGTIAAARCKHVDDGVSPSEDWALKKKRENSPPR